MKLKWLASALLVPILANCSSSPRTPSPESLAAARTHFEAVEAAIAESWEAYEVFEQLGNPYRPEGLPALERITEAMKAVNTTAADRTQLDSVELEALGLVVGQNAEAALAAWMHAASRFRAMILQHKKIWNGKQLSPRVDDVYWVFEKTSHAMDASLRHALYQVDELVCEGSGGQWNHDMSACD